MHCVRMWLARADCSKLCKKKEKKKRLYSDKTKKNIGLCRVSKHVVFVKRNDIKNKKTSTGRGMLASM